MLRGKNFISANEADAEAAYRKILNKNGYQFTQIIGRGGMSRVDEVRQLSTGELKAIKHLGINPPPEKIDRFKKTLKRESEYTFDHPNVLKGEGYFTGGGGIFFIMPRMQHNLGHLILDNNEYEILFLLDIVTQTVAGLNYLHQNDLIHRDLKPSNILYNIDHHGIWVVICDFGLSQDKAAKIKSDLSRMFGGKRRAGTLSYSAPEQMHKNGKYDKRCDIYALGRLMDELFAKKTMKNGDFISTFQDDRKIHALSKKVYLYKRERPHILESNVQKVLPSSLVSLILRCLQKNPGRRPGDVVQIFYELTKIQQECRSSKGSERLRRMALTYRPQ